MRIANLGAVRTSDIRKPGIEHVAGVVLPLTEQRTPRRAAGVVGALRVNLALRIGLAGLRVPLGRSALLRDSGGRTAVPVEFGHRVPALQQEPAAERRGPLEIADEVMRLLRIAELPDSWIGAGRKVLALALPPPRHEQRDLVALGRLPGQSHRGTTHVGVQIRVDDLSVWRDDLRRNVRHQFIGGLMPRGDEEPRPVALDRPAKRRRKHVNVLDGVGAANALRRALQERIDIVGLPVAAAEAEKRRAAEHVAAVFQHAVQANAAAGGISRNRARHHGDLRLQHVVEVRLRGPLEALNRHAFHQLLGIVATEAVRPEGHLLGHARAADVWRSRAHTWRQHANRHDVA